MLTRVFFGLAGNRQFANMEEAKTAYPQWEKGLKETLTDTKAVDRAIQTHTPFDPLLFERGYL